MKPTKSSSIPTGCDPVSSNCVIWQGACLDCINVRTGDSVSTVVAELATQLCAIKDLLDFTDLDLQCLFDSCISCPEPDKRIGNVLALLITKVCDLEDIINGEVPEPDPADELVTVATCFQTVDLEEDPVTTMTLRDYTLAIGIKVCSILATVTEHTATLEDHETRITALENADPDPYVLPSFTPVCVIESVDPVPINEILEALEEQFCDLRATTGTSTDLTSAIANQCAGLNSEDALSTGGTMSGIAGWKTTVSTVADSLTNLWLTICDMREAVKLTQECCATTCADVIVDFLVSIVDNGATAKIWFAGYSNIPAGFSDCAGTSPMVITDGVGGSYTVNVDTSASAASATPISVDLTATPLSTEFTYTFTFNSCLTDETITCNKTVIKTASISASSCSAPTDVVAIIS